MPTKGVHVVVPRLDLSDALILPNAGDGRPFFVIPWDDRSLVGTTDTRYEGDPSRVRVEAADVDYLLAAARRYLPEAGLTRQSISYAFAGLRPLVAPSRGDVPEGRVSRRHRIVVTPPGLITLVGGKYTTFRRMAEETVDRLLKVLGRAKVPSVTRHAAFLPEKTPTRRPGPDDSLWAHLSASYGPRAGEVYDLCLSEERFQRPVVESSPVRLGQLAYALLAEKALTLDDLLFRRTRLVWQPDLTSAAARRIADELAPLFDDVARAYDQADSIEERLCRGRATAEPDAASL